MRYRHLQPLVVATVALDGMEMALELLLWVLIRPPADGDEARRLYAFSAPRIANPGHFDERPVPRLSGSFRRAEPRKGARRWPLRCGHKFLEYAFPWFSHFWPAE